MRLSNACHDLTSACITLYLISQEMDAWYQRRQGTTAMTGVITVLVLRTEGLTLALSRNNGLDSVAAPRANLKGRMRARIWKRRQKGGRRKSRHRFLASVAPTARSLVKHSLTLPSISPCPCLVASAVASLFAGSRDARCIMAGIPCLPTTRVSPPCLCDRMFSEAQKLG